jgi:hypothetical protein
MQEELNNFTRNEVWHLAPRPNQDVVDTCNTRILGVQNPGANINTRCAGTKSHTYDV